MSWKTVYEIAEKRASTKIGTDSLSLREKKILGWYTEDEFSKMVMKSIFG